MSIASLELAAAILMLALVVGLASPGMWWALLCELVSWVFETP